MNSESNGAATARSADSAQNQLMAALAGMNLTALGTFFTKTFSRLSILTNLIIPAVTSPQDLETAIGSAEKIAALSQVLFSEATELLRTNIAADPKMVAECVVQRFREGMQNECGDSLSQSSQPIEFSIQGNPARCCPKGW
jgi:hypothetical protein